MLAGWLGALLPLLLALSLPLPVLAAAAGCDLHWQVTPQHDTVPPQLAVTLTLDAGNRSRTELQLPDGSDVALLAGPGTPALEPVPGRPLVRSLAHRPGERLSLRFVVMPGASTWLRLGPDSLLFAAPALLPLPTERGPSGPLQMCLGVDGLADSDALLANQGQTSSAERLLRLQGPATLARDWVVAAGALQQAERRVEGQPLRVVMAAASPMAFNADALADAAARQLASVRRFWGDAEAPGQLLLALPAPADVPARGMTLHQGTLLQLPTLLTLPGSQIDALLMQAAQQAWFRERFGPVAYEQRPDDAMNAWFSQGFAGFYSQRLRTSTGQQSLQAHAAALTSLLQFDAAAGAGASASAAPGLAPLTAPWLAMRWHSALREQGQSGLDAVLKRLIVPAAQARAVGPLSSPLATHRLQAALRHLLADAPRRDLQQWVERSGPPDLNAATLGPCFRYDPGTQQVLPGSDGEPTASCQGWLNGSEPPAGSRAKAPMAKPSAKAGKKGGTKTSAKGAAKPKKSKQRARQ